MTKQQYDPSRTLTLRRKFSSDLYNRMRALKGLVRGSIQKQDVFGLTNTYLPKKKEYSEFAKIDKAMSYLNWLEEQEESTVLETTKSGNWFDPYITTAFTMGAKIAYSDAKQKKYPTTIIDERGGVDAVLRGTEATDELDVLKLGVYNQFKGVVNTMNQQISTKLVSGTLQDTAPSVLVDSINNRIDKIGVTRGRQTARTETVRAHVFGLALVYGLIGATHFEVMAEWVTAGDNRVCARCSPNDRRVLPLEEIKRLLPFHPDCRCSYRVVPFNMLVPGVVLLPGEE